MKQDVENLGDLGRSLSDSDVAAILGVSIPVVRRQAKRFGAIRVGRKYVFFESVVVDILRDMLALSLDSASVEPSAYPLVDFAVSEHGKKEKISVGDRHGLLA